MYFIHMKYIYFQVHEYFLENTTEVTMNKIITIYMWIKTFQQTFTYCFKNADDYIFLADDDKWQ